MQTNSKVRREQSVLDLEYFKFLFKRNPKCQAEFTWFRKQLDIREHIDEEHLIYEYMMYITSHRKGKRDLSAPYDDDYCLRRDEYNIK